MKCLELEQINTSDPNSFWDYIKRLGPKKKSGIPWECYGDDGAVIYDTDTILDKWKNDFCSLYSPQNETLEPCDIDFKAKIIEANTIFEQKNEEGSLSCLNTPLTQDEINKSISKAKCNKAPGVDGIVYDVLKNDSSALLLTRLFNVCFEKRKVPDDWLNSLIYPIPKSVNNDPRVPLYYRGISLLSVLSKLYTSTLNARLNKAIEDNELVVNEQNGFREDRSCLDHIFVLQNALRIRNELNSQTFCAFIDFKKAFDYIDRYFLLHKLQKIGISGHFYHAIKSLYANTRSSVQVNDKYTDWFEVKSGVRQGDSLSPTLFSLFINDLAQEVKDLDAGIMIGGLCLSILLYADDIVLLAPTAEKLQSMLGVVTTWCRKWGMKINVSKTQIMHIRNRQRPRSNFQFSCSGSSLAYTESYKYLGYTLHEHLSNACTVDVLTAAASRSFGRIHSIFKRMGNMGIASYETLYKSYVLPIMNYASAVWGFESFTKPQVLQNRISRFFLGVHRFAPVAATKLEMDWLDCREGRWLEMLRLFNRINTMDNTRLPRVVYDWDVSLGLEAWASEVQHIAAYLGLDAHPDDNETYSLTVAYNTLLNKNRLSWQLEADRKPKLRTFNQIHDFNFPLYLVKCDLTRYQRSLVAQIKMGILPLKYETDRYQGIPPENRICKTCPLNEPEDEIHFLFKCSSLHTTRLPLLERFLNRTDGQDEFHSADDIGKFRIMIHKQNLQLTGHYIEQLYRERQKILYTY